MAFLGYDLTKAKIHCLEFEGNGFFNFVNTL